MRKSLAAFILLFFISAGALIYGASAVNLRQDRVQVTEETVLGDRQAASDVTVTRNVHCYNRLMWSIAKTGENPPDTDFTFSQSPVYRERQRKFGGLQADMALNFGVGSTGGIDDADLCGWEEAVAEAASGVPAGGKGSKVLKLRDFREEFYLNASLDIPANNIVWDHGGEYYETNLGSAEEFLSEKFSESFRIPVPENLTANVEVEKNKDGELVDVNFSGDGDYWLYLNCISVADETGCWFDFSVVSEEGTVEGAGYPQGRGVYVIPYEIENGAAVLTEDIWELFCPLDDGAQTLWMGFSADKGKILLLTAENGKYIFTALDKQTGEKLQELELMDCGEDLSLLLPYQGEDFLTFVDVSGELRVVTEDKGVYSLGLGGSGGSFFEVLNDDGLYNEIAMDCDGEKLAVAMGRYSLPEEEFCGWYLGVIDGTGVTYIGRSQVSLDTDNRNLYSNYQCRGQSDGSLEVTIG